MAKIVAVTSCPTGIAHTFMAAEGIEQAAGVLGHQVKVETQGSIGAQNTLSAADIAEADIVLIAADTNVDTNRFAGKRIHFAPTKEAIHDGQALITRALAQASAGGTATAAATPVAAGGARIVAITSCPTGIAHTFMAAESLEQAGKKLGSTIKVETQGSVGAQNALTPAEIAAADIVLIAADTNVDLSRFAGKRVYNASTKDAIHDGPGLITRALSEAKLGAGSAAPTSNYAEQVKDAKAQQAAARTGVYKHLMTGVSYMIPFVVAGGLLIALGFALGGIYVDKDEYKDTLGWALFTIGAKNGFALMVPILSGYIAYSIADRPGLAPGMIGGMIAAAIGSSFLGGIVAGFLAGYVVKFLNDKIQLGRNLDGLKPVLILPLLGTTIVGLLMIFVVGKPVAGALAVITEWLKGMQGSSAAVLGLLLGAMMAFDMGGPVNKAAYAFSTGLLASQIFAPMAATMAAGMTPPLGIALATILFRDRFTVDEREAGKATSVLGIAFITEGAIPFAAKDPLRVIPALMVGSALTGALSMVFGCQLHVPHGGVFVLFIPNAVDNLGSYLVAIIAGTIVTAAMLRVLKKSVAQ